MTLFNGTSANDVITGTRDVDQISGNGGDDLIDGGDGSDTIDGGDGTDTITYANAAFGVSVFLAPIVGELPAAFTFYNNPDLLTSIENVIGSDREDRLYGNADANRLDGGAGDDFLASFGVATVLSPTSLQVAIADLGSAVDTLMGGNGNDTLSGGFGDALDGGAGADRIFVSLQAAPGPVVADLTAAFGGGSASLGIGSLANVEIIENLGLTNFDDVVTIGEAGSAYHAPQFNRPGLSDPLSGGGVYGYGGNDAITGGSKSNVLWGGNGNDLLSGLGGDDYLVGGSGVDRLLGGDGKDVLIAGGFTFNGALGNPYAFDLAHVTKVVDTDTGETMSGGAGDDMIIAAFGDVIDGGDDFDTLILDFSDAAAPVIFDQAVSAANATAITNVELIEIQLTGFSDHVDLTALTGAPFTSDQSGYIRLHAGNGNDVISGGNDVFGEGGNDTLIGSAGDDQLDGGDGNDFLNGGTGLNYLAGGAGNDHLVASGFDNFEGGDGDDILGGSPVPLVAADAQRFFAPLLPIGSNLAALGTIQAAAYFSALSGVRVDLSIVGAAQNTLSAGFDTLNASINGVWGSSFNDSLTGNNSANAIWGGFGDDRIDGAAGDDLLFGDVGNDVLLGGEGNDILDGDLGNDIVSGGLGIDTASYASAEAVVTVNLALQAEYGFAGAQATGAAGLDTLTGIENLTGSNYGDRLTGSVANNVIAAGLGNDIVDGGDGADTLDGGAGNDKLSGGAGDDLLVGGVGDDIINGGTGIDTVSYASSEAAISLNMFYATTQQTGGAGRDTVSLVENIIGSAFGDTLTGGTGDNVIYGAEGNDFLAGGLGNDTLRGGEGNDTLNGGGGNDVLDGGDGVDLANYAAATAGITVSLATSAAQETGGAGLDTLTNIEKLTGSAFADSLTGSSGNNVLTGNAGNDVLDGGAGNDTLSGGAGDDLLTGGLGDDITIGGAGIDTVSYAASEAAIKLNLSYATAQQTGGGGRDTVSQVENVIGSVVGDTLTGSGSDNLLDGGKGADTLAGGLGNDTLLGGDGADMLTGGAGADLLRGGLGADIFRFTALGDSTVAAVGQDTLLDFNRAEGDRIGLALIDADTTRAGDNAFTLAAAFTRTAGQLTVAFDAAAGNYLVAGDVNGDGLPDFTFHVVSATGLVGSDFYP